MIVNIKQKKWQSMHHYLIFKQRITLLSFYEQTSHEFQSCKYLQFRTVLLFNAFSPNRRKNYALFVGMFVFHMYVFFVNV
jgi:hypothetical protein